MWLVFGPHNERFSSMLRWNFESVRKYEENLTRKLVPCIHLLLILYLCSSEYRRETTLVLYSTHSMPYKLHLNSCSENFSPTETPKLFECNTIYEHLPPTSLIRWSPMILFECPYAQRKLPKPISSSHWCRFITPRIRIDSYSKINCWRRILFHIKYFRISSNRNWYAQERRNACHFWPDNYIYSLCELPLQCVPLFYSWYAACLVHFIFMPMSVTNKFTVITAPLGIRVH